MPCYTAAPTELRRCGWAGAAARAARALLLLVALWAAAPLRAQPPAAVAAPVPLASVASVVLAPQVELQRMRIERNEDGVFLSGRVKFELPTVVEDALRKGIPMFFVAKADIARSRWYWSDAVVASSARHTRLAYQPLTRRWRLNSAANPLGSSGLGMGFSQTFDALPDALAAIQRISHWRLADAAAVTSDSRYQLDFSFQLDTSQLPRPFQLGVVGRSDWELVGRYSMPVPPQVSPPTPALTPAPAPPASAQPQPQPPLEGH